MDDFSKKIIELERMVHDLKVFKKVPPTVDFYSATFTPTNLVYPVVITYREGEQPLIADFYSTVLTTMPGEAVDNVQKVALRGQAAGALTIEANRPILSITQESGS